MGYNRVFYSRFQPALHSTNGLHAGYRQPLADIGDEERIVMKNFMEKRNSERFYLKAPIKYRTARVQNTREANMFNCSEGGLYFETNSPLNPGVEVSVSAAGQDRYFRASIKWCQRVGPTEKSIYGVGAEYY